MRRIAIAVLSLGLTLSTAWTVVNNPPRPKAKQSTTRNTEDINIRDVLKLRNYIPKRKKRYATFTVTAYTANDRGMNGRAITASGKMATPFYTVAASSKWPMGTQFKTPDGQLWEVSDRGDAITADNRLDLYVGRSNKRTAYQWGVRNVTVEIVRIGEGR